MYRNQIIVYYLIVCNTANRKCIGGTAYIALNIYFDNITAFIRIDIASDTACVFFQQEIMISVYIKADIFKSNLFSVVLHRSNVIPEDDLFIRSPVLADQSFVFTVIKAVAQFIQIKCIFLLFIRNQTIQQFGRVQFRLETNQLTAIIGIEMAFGISTDIGVVADHCSAVVTTGDFNQSLRSNHMTKFRSARAFDCSGCIGVIVNDGNTVACFNC